MPLSRFERLLRWLRAGYPEGIPPGDYPVIFGVLSRELTPEEIDTVAMLMIKEGDISATNDTIRSLVEKQVLNPPTDDEVQRISEKLAAMGWPLSEFFPPGEAPMPPPVESDE